jgi:BirA family biotin operon repressor/biotin-[acetyl-CoA-carboxylase] ligase
LQKYNKDIFLKWPNDIYIKDKKMGGVVTYFTKNRFIVGIGVNLVKRSDNFGFIELKNAHKLILEPYFLLLKKAPSWQEIFNKFRVEFKNSFDFDVHTKEGRKSLKDATLCEDGSLIINNERIYSLR